MPLRILTCPIPRVHDLERVGPFGEYHLGIRVAFGCDLETGCPSAASVDAVAALSREVRSSSCYLEAPLATDMSSPDNHVT